MPYNNFHPSAGWQTAEVDNTAFKDRVRHPLHPLVRHAWFTKYTYRHCMLHMIDHHGVASHVAATILWQHMGGDRECNAIPGNNIEERLHFLNDGKHAVYSQFHVHNRLPSLKDDNLKNW